jgi:hypothetical protein
VPTGAWGVPQQAAKWAHFALLAELAKPPKSPIWQRRSRCILAVSWKMQMFFVHGYGRITPAFSVLNLKFATRQNY